MSDVTTITTCHHPRCHTSIRGHELACHQHWTELPIALRNRIWRTWKSGDKAAHGQAITAALKLWVAAIEEAERPARCHNCKSETILEDPDNDNKPICLTCARAALPGGPTRQACSRCRSDTGLLIAVDAGDGMGPDLCADCQLQVAR
jgi:hypothetical protein